MALSCSAGSRRLGSCWRCFPGNGLYGVVGELSRPVALTPLEDRPDQIERNRIGTRPCAAPGRGPACVMEPEHIPSQGGGIEIDGAADRTVLHNKRSETPQRD